MEHQSELTALPPSRLDVPISPTFLVTSALLSRSFLWAVIFPTGCGTRDPTTRYCIDPLSEERSVRRLNSSWQERTALPGCTCTAGAAAVALILMSRHCKCVHLCSNREETVNLDRLPGWLRWQTWNKGKAILIQMKCVSVF